MALTLEEISRIFLQNKDVTTAALNRRPVYAHIALLDKALRDFNGRWARLFQIMILDHDAYRVRLLQREHDREIRKKTPEQLKAECMRPTLDSRYDPPRMSFDYSTLAMIASEHDRDVAVYGELKALCLDKRMRSVIRLTYQAGTPALRVCVFAPGLQRDEVEDKATPQFSTYLNFTVSNWQNEFETLLSAWTGACTALAASPVAADLPASRVRHHDFGIK